MVIVRYKSAEEAKHLLRKVKRMKKDIEEVVECLEEKMEEMEGDESEYDYEEPMYRGDTSYRGGSYRSRYRMGR